MISKEKKAAIIAEYGRNPGDRGTERDPFCQKRRAYRAF